MTARSANYVTVDDVLQGAVLLAVQSAVVQESVINKPVSVQSLPDADLSRIATQVASVTVWPMEATASLAVVA